MIAGILQELSGAANSQVLKVFEQHHDERRCEFWRKDPRLYRAFGSRLLEADHPIRAYELLREGLLHHPNDLEIKYRLALALARGRNISKAEEYALELAEYLQAGRRLRGEVWSLLGRLKKDRYEQNRDAARKPGLALESAKLYEQAHDETGDPFPGVNAATMYLLGGMDERARELAWRVIQQAGEIRRQPGREEDYWLMASQGEANLILGHESEAISLYRQAAQKGKDEPASVASMRRQLQLLEARIPVSDELWAVFNVGCVVVFAGHMIDHPARQVRPRFPPDLALQDMVSAEIRKELQRLNATIAYCSPACGSDVLFAEQILDRGAELHLVLPFDLNDFYRTSVDFGMPNMDTWRQRCDLLLSRATETHYATKEAYLGHDVLFEFANTFSQGLAIVHGERIWRDAHALVVLDPESEAGPACGGTASFLQTWKSGNHSSTTIDLATVRSRCVLSGSSPGADFVPSAHVQEPPAIRRQIQFMLFGDLKNFSGLEDIKAPSFFANYPETICRVLGSLAKEQQPVFRNTWGYGLFLVFNEVTDCAEFALRLLEEVGRIDWTALGLTQGTSLRIGLHAGPVYRGLDPIIGKENFFGSHVVRTARIEPVAGLGCAFASEQFAAALAAKPGHEFACEYVGVEALAKGYDRCALYCLNRR